MGRVGPRFSSFHLSRPPRGNTHPGNEWRSAHCHWPTAFPTFWLVHCSSFVTSWDQTWRTILQVNTLHKVQYFCAGEVEKNKRSNVWFLLLRTLEKACTLMSQQERSFLPWAKYCLETLSLAWMSLLIQRQIPRKEEWIEFSGSIQVRSQERQSWKWSAEIWSETQLTSVVKGCGTVRTGRNIARQHTKTRFLQVFRSWFSSEQPLEVDNLILRKS